MIEKQYANIMRICKLSFILLYHSNILERVFIIFHSPVLASGCFDEVHL